MPDAYVVDSSVVIRWYLDQPGFEHAREIQDRLLAGTVALSAPDVCRWEVMNVLRGHGLAQGRLTEQDVLGCLDDLETFGVEVHQTGREGLRRITALACRHGLSLFDAAFVELSLRSGRTLLTADARLARGVAGLVSTEVLRGAAPGPLPS